MTQSQYAKHRGISQQRVAVYIRQGKIGKKSYKRKGNTYDIDPAKADADLEKNLDPINRNQNKTKTKPSDENKTKSKKPTRKKKPSEEEMAETINKSDFRDLDYSEARTFLTKYKGALVQLEYEEEKKLSIPAESVIKDADALGRLVKGLFTAMPPRTAPLLAAESDPFKVQQMMIKEINQILNEIADTLLGVLK